MWLLIDCCCANNNCDRPLCYLPHRPPRISEPLFITASMHGHDEEKRTNQNLFVCSGKSEMEVTNNRRLHLMYCIIKANYWQTWSIVRPLCDSRATCHYASSFIKCLFGVLTSSRLNQFFSNNKNNSNNNLHVCVFLQQMGYSSPSPGNFSVRQF